MLIWQVYISFFNFEENEKNVIQSKHWYKYWIVHLHKFMCNKKADINNNSE